MRGLFHLMSVLCLGLFTPALVACDDDDDRDEAAPAELSDGEIAAVALAINTGEIDQGELAQARAQRSDVRAFGEQMVTEHSRAVERLGELLTEQRITPVPSDLSRQVTDDAEAALAELQTLEGDAFDRRYVTVQVQMHATALAIIRDRLLPDVDDDRLAQEFEAMELRVAAHLEEAQRLDAALD